MLFSFPIRARLLSMSGLRRRLAGRRRPRSPSQLAVQSLEPKLALAAVAQNADATAPQVKAIVAPAARTYMEGDTIRFRVNFSEKVFVTGSPTLPVAIGGTVRDAVWNGKGGSGGKSLVFTTVVQPGDEATDGLRISGEIDLGEGDSIRDRAGNDLNPRITGSFPRVKVDAVAPAVANIGPVKVTSKSVVVRALFSEPVIVKGRPHISFTVDGQPRKLTYAGGSGSSVLTFRYRPAKGETPTAENVDVPRREIVASTGQIVDKARNGARSLVDSDLPTSSENKKSLMSSDWLRVDRETGELFGGDEPVLMTLKVNTVLGKAYSTTVDLVPSLPSELASGVDEGDTVSIPDATGDIWFNNVKPLDSFDILSALLNETAVEIPVQMTIRLAFEGDMSNSYLLGAAGGYLAGTIGENLAPVLEKVSIKPSDFVKFDESGKVNVDKEAALGVMNKALAELKSAVDLSGLQITNAILVKVLDWITAVSDPDDLVGIAVTAMVPVSDGLVADLKAAGGPAKLGLESNWTKASSKSITEPSLSYSGDVQLRTGLLVGGKQSWETRIQGRTRGYGRADNNWAEYVVGTDAWRDVTW